MDIETILLDYRKFPYKSVVLEGGEKVGRYRVNQTQYSCLEVVKLEANSAYGPHKHSVSDEQLTVIEGSGKAIVNGKKIPYPEEIQFDIPKGTSHGFQTSEVTYLLSAQTPQIVDEETGIADIVPG